MARAITNLSPALREALITISRCWRASSSDYRDGDWIGAISEGLGITEKAAYMRLHRLEMKRCIHDASDNCDGLPRMCLIQITPVGWATLDHIKAGDTESGADDAGGALDAPADGAKHPDFLEAMISRMAVALGTPDGARADDVAAEVERLVRRNVQLTVERAESDEELDSMRARLLGTLGIRAGSGWQVVLHVVEQLVAEVNELGERLKEANRRTLTKRQVQILKEGVAWADTHEEGASQYMAGVMMMLAASLPEPEQGDKKA